MQLYTKILIGMAVGIILGFLLGPNSQLLPQSAVYLSPQAEVYLAPDQDRQPLARGLRKAAIIADHGDWLQIQWTLTPNLILRLAEAGDDEVGLKAGTEAMGWVRDDPLQVQRYAPLGQRLIDATAWIGQLFLAMIKMVVIPLVFFSLVTGVASLGNPRALGRLGGRTLAYFMGTTVVALLIGVTLANLIQPGALLTEADRAGLLASYGSSVGQTVANAVDSPGLVDQLLAIVPSNPIAALANGEMLQVIFFALMLGVALTLMHEDQAQPVVDGCTRLNEAMVMLVHLAMVLAPFGVAALLFKVVGSTGLSVLLALAVYGLVVLAGLFLHVFLTYHAILRLGARLPLGRFLLAIKEALLVAFSTSSSSATLPVTKEACEDRVNISPKITSFVLPLGATVNMDGTALYQGVAAVFIAQIYGIDLSLGEQATIVVSATLASVGAAGVPGAGMITLAMVLTAIGVPTEGLALILGVDRLLDMFRTMTNVVGDATASALMARLEGESLHFLSAAEDRADSDRGFNARLKGGMHPVVSQPRS